ncbi:gliding motility-associated lipoprotein GldJ [Pedobacter glucosidilyticus]|uniref:SUMF1/EgtB/PvdO family nonheme iron enzyme n=2 Tax=Pedobacter aquae TaxID=2605747 RepID=A0A5C0VPD8_9SPHI|nr:gliding motility-associated lipoprotein GldJ [Pedobacter glucosidilyticus]QEK52774.1 SUMF1/EgtB/PvdO family nonheme iron enzyme [Pedobacter aquae]
MRKNTITFLSACICLMMILSSCQKNAGPSKISGKTGALYNQKRPGSLQVMPKTKPTPGPGLVHIEGGTFVLGGSTIDDIGYDYASPKRRVSVATFYMDETEVANLDWLEYLNWIKEVAADTRWYYEALPDTLVWRSPLAYNEPYVNNYLRHPAYQDYPVVGVTWEQANAYCDWRTNVVNENILRNKGIMNNWGAYSAAKMGTAKGGKGGAAAATGNKVNTEPFDLDLYLNGQYNDLGKGAPRPNVVTAQAQPQAGGKKGAANTGRIAKIEDGVFTPGRYRLPTEAEWEYAALALRSDGSNSIVKSGKVYPWYGIGVRSPNKDTRGLIYANFKRGGGDNMGVAGYLNDGADITAPVKAYIPNDFGLFNMAGNVSEWTSDTYRQLSFDEVEDFNPYRGNVFENNAYDDKGQIQTIGKTNVPKKVKATAGKKDAYEIQKSKYGNATEPSPSTPEPKDDKMASAVPTFNADQRGYIDTENLDLYGKITLISDRSKVFKGGSWNDRAYWLNPGTRRYLDQGEASSEIGFRCAMSSVGDPQINPKSTPQFRQPKSRVGFKK